MKDEETLTKETTNYKELGMALFSSANSTDKIREILFKLLAEKKFDAVAEFTSGSYLSKQYLNNDFLSHKTADSFVISERYFYVFMELCRDFEVKVSDIEELFFFAFYSTGALSEWKYPIEQQLYQLALVNYEKYIELLTRYDSQFLTFNVAIMAEKNRAIAFLIDKILDCAKEQDLAIRKILIDYPSEVVSILLPEYNASPINIKIKLIDVILIFKNYYKVEAFLDDLVSSADTPKAILKIINKKPILVRNKKANYNYEYSPNGEYECKLIDSESEKKVVFSIDEKLNVHCNLTVDDTIAPILAQIQEDIAFELTNCEQEMIVRKSYTTLEFKDKLRNGLFRKVAETLFFSVYIGESLENMVTINNGEICNLDNEVITLDEGMILRFFHPAELVTKNEYLKSLGIKQPFPQLDREVFLSSELDISSNKCQRFVGQLTSGASLKKNMSDLGFKPIKKSYVDCSEIYKVIGDIMCVLECSPTSFARDTLVSLKTAKFYDINDIIILKGIVLLENVPNINLVSINECVYSEFLYAIDKLSK